MDGAKAATDTIDNREVVVGRRLAWGEAFLRREVDRAGMIILVIVGS